RLFVLALTIPPPESWAPYKLLTSVEPLGELVASEQLDRAVELALKARRRLLAGLAEPLVEGHHRDLGVPLDLPLGHPREPFGLAALPLDEHDVEACPHVRLALLDRLGDRRLARAEPLGRLLDRTPALEGLGLELVERLADRLSGGALELLAQPEHRLPLLVRRRAELARLALEACLDVGDGLLVPLLESRELRFEVALGALEVLREAAQALLEAALAAGQLLGEALARTALSLLELDAALLREPSFLHAEQGCCLGSLACEHAPDLFGVRRGLGRDRFADGRARLRDEGVGCDRRRPDASQRDPQERREDQRAGEAPGEDPHGHRCRVLRPAARGDRPRGRRSRRRGAEARPRASRATPSA